jgi:hypothetical protein
VIALAMAVSFRGLMHVCLSLFCYIQRVVHCITDLASLSSIASRPENGRMNSTDVVMSWKK